MEAELSRAETELQSEESALHAELSRLAQVSAELSTRLQTLGSQAAQAGEGAIVQRAKAALPAIDPDAGRAQARAAREAAIRARREVHAAVRSQLANAKAQLQQLTHQLMADEKVIASAQERARMAVHAAPAPVPAPAPAKRPQRISPRVKMQAVVDLHSDDNFFNGFSANISDGGLFVATVNILPIGTQVDLSFSLPTGERIEANGVVQWVREVNDQHPDAFPGMGVQFAALNAAAESAIGSFVAQREPLFFATA